MFIKWILKSHHIKIAKTEEEKQAVFRFRYHIYKNEMNKKFMGLVDDEQQIIKDQYDDIKNTAILYVGSVKKIRATMRISWWDAAIVPVEIKNSFNTSIFAPTSNIARVDYFLLSREMRGKMLIFKLTATIFDLIMRNKQPINLVFCSCMPGLVNHYKRLGFRLYPSSPIYYKDGIRIPMVMLPFNIHYFKKNKIATYYITKYFSSRYKSYYEDKIKLEMNITAVNASNRAIYLNKNIINNKLSCLYDQMRGKESIFSYLSIKYLVDISSVAITMDAKKTITLEEVEDSEIYLILKGQFQVSFQDYTIRRLGPGDIFGEVAYFLNPARRFSTVKSITCGEVLTIKRGALKKIIEQHPSEGIRILMFLSKTLSKELVHIKGRFCNLT